MQAGDRQLVYLRTLPDAFGAQVLAARLGADGIVTELRGSLGGPYPLGSVSVWVLAHDADTARELLLADEVESAFEPADWPSSDWRDNTFAWRHRRLFAAVVLVLTVMVLTVTFMRL
jgi:hypothetical protein